MKYNIAEIDERHTSWNPLLAVAPSIGEAIVRRVNYVR
jgi:hypothetical protein